MALIPATNTASPLLSYPAALSHLISKGWTVVSEGSSGAQLTRGRVMRTQTKVVLAIGIVGLFAFGLGLFFIAIALIDYYGGQKPQSHFLVRDQPTLPAPEGKRKTPVLIKILLGLLFALVALAILGAAFRK